ncbi:Zeta toxin [Frankia casuarinae]|uniref:UDP-N-acetylglucosamine kinase n=1 Tax=Frankia casuarinae (strain DSM 45818 / CECT 9043 / HFP020203 / CcI3) TaxID=106370 RepID=Q2J943_FRACC|nr:Zeta toxin [Frankia casuarinae]
MPGASEYDTVGPVTRMALFCPGSVHGCSPVSGQVTAVTPAEFRGLETAPERPDAGGGPVPEQSRVTEIDRKLDLLDRAASPGDSPEPRHQERPAGRDAPSRNTSSIDAKLDLLDRAALARSGGGAATPADTTGDRPSEVRPPTEPGNSDRARTEAKLALLEDAARRYRPEPPDAPAPGRERWAVREAPRTLPDDHPLLTPTDTINTPERAALRENLVKEVIGDAKPPEQGSPTLDLMGGGGASGKGFVLEYLKDEGQVPTENVVHLDPDEIKKMIPEFDEIMGAGDSRAAEVVHEESSSLAKGVLQQAMDRRLNIIYDSTLGNPEKTAKLIDDAHAKGYEVRLFGVSADPELAVTRAADRAAKSGRYVPVDHQLAAHRGFSQGFEGYAEKADKVRLYDTNSEPRQIARKRAGEILTILDQGSYDKFQNKININPEAMGPTSLYTDRGENQ